MLPWVLAAVAALTGLWLWMQELGRRRAAELKLSFAEKLAEEKLAMLKESQEQLKNSFTALSSEALEKNNRSFLDLAKTPLEKFQEGAKRGFGETADRDQRIARNPVKDSLQKLDLGIRQDWRESAEATAKSLRIQIQSLFENEKLLKQETSNLVKALRMPLTRGRWGEIQLRRVVELAGMLNHCDFFEQQQEISDAGRLRPDLIVRLPGGRQVVIDAKVPLEAYLEAVHTEGKLCVCSA